MCFRPKPLADCRAFVFFDGVGAVGVLRMHHQLAPGLSVADDFTPYGGGAVGFMTNVDPTHSLGLSLEFAVASEGNARWAAKGHWRRWSPNRTSLDVAAGPLVMDFTARDAAACEQCIRRERGAGATASVSLIERHGLGAFAGADVARGAGRTSVGLHVGARLEGYSAAIAALAAGAGFAILWKGLSSQSD
jgi:hypothetical protein